MLKFLSSMLCTSKRHPFSLGNYLGTSLLDYELEDVYNMDVTGLHSRAHPNKILAQRKVKGRKLQKERATFALAVNSTGTDKLKLLMLNTCKQP
jgi:hypothetical protein